MSHANERHDAESPPPTPRWVKLSVVIAILLVVLFVILHLTGLAPMGHGM